MPDRPAADAHRRPSWWPWAALVLGVLGLQVVLHASGIREYQQLVVDPAELTDDLDALDAAVVTIGVVALSVAGAIGLFAASLRNAATHLQAPLRAIGVLALALAVDDRFRLHEGLAELTGITETLFLAAFPMAVLGIAWRWSDDLRPEAPWAAVFAVGFGISFAFDAVVEELLGLSFFGETFIEENAKFVGIVGLLALVVHLARRAVDERPAP